MNLKQINWQIQLVKKLLEKSVESNDYEASHRFSRLLSTLKDSKIEFYEKQKGNQQ